MTNKDRVELLRDLANDIENGALLVGEVSEATQPKHPKPGTVVEWRPLFGDGWLKGIVSYKCEGVYDSCGYFHVWDAIEYRPVFVVTPPPSTVDTWQGRVWEVFEHHAGVMAPVPNHYHPAGWGGHLGRITWEEMEQREADE